MNNSNPKNSPDVVLVDGSSYLFRAFYALPDLRANSSDENSQPTGAIRGMINMLGKIKKDYPEAKYFACVFDAKGKTFRDEIYPEYKATRKETPEELKRQIEPIHKIVSLLGWKVLNVSGVEADDVIATIAKIANSQNLSVLISSGDKDFAQLVNEQLIIIDTMSDKLRDIEGVKTEFGVYPAQMLDYQILLGDAVDNVRGVEKVGKVTATKLLTQYGTLEEIIKNASSIKGVVGANLQKAINWLPTAKKLLKMKDDCELKEHLPNLPALTDLNFITPQDEQKKQIQELYKSWNFKSLLNTLEQTSEQNQNPNPKQAQEIQETNYKTINTLEELNELIKEINQAPLTAIDTETTSLDPIKAEIVGISLSTKTGKAAYIPLTHKEPSMPALAAGQLEKQIVLEKLKPWLENNEKEKIGQNINYDRHIFANEKINIKGYKHDTMLQSYVLEVHQPHNLESLAKRHLNREGLSYEEICGKGAKQITFDKVEIQKAAQYACEDADFTYAIHEHLYPQIQKEKELKEIYELEINTSQILFEMERIGAQIDKNELGKQSEELGKQIAEIQEKSWQLAGQQFNLSSPKQIGEILFEKLKLPITKKTATGQPSTDESVLEELAENYPLPAQLLKHRSLSKLKSTYTDKLPQLADKNSRVHTHYSQSTVITGRLSSSEPNLQNIPVRTSEGRKIRKAFTAREGFQIMSCDYSQIELRIMAHLSQDKTLINAFQKGQDIHKATAAEIMNISLEEVTPEQRRWAKTINFGLIYGMSSYGLAKALNLENQAAKNYINRYFEKYPDIKNYMESAKQSAIENGYVKTIFGRKLIMPEIKSTNRVRKAAAERAAINAPMQGSAADLIKKAMCKIQEALKDKKTKMIMQVHDELIFEVATEELNWAKETLPKLMNQAAKLEVELQTETGIGANWNDAH